MAKYGASAKGLAHEGSTSQESDVSEKCWRIGNKISPGRALLLTTTLKENEDFTELMASDSAAKELLGFVKNLVALHQPSCSPNSFRL